VLLITYYEAFQYFAAALLILNALNGVAQSTNLIYGSSNKSKIYSRFSSLSIIISAFSAAITILILCYSTPHSRSPSFTASRAETILKLDSPVCMYSLSCLVVIASHHIGLSLRAMKLISSAVLLNLVPLNKVIKSLFPLYM